MRKRKLGSEGPEISVIGFGTWEAGGSWGEKVPDEQIIKALHAGFDAGMNWVDTAEVYGSEELVGRAVKGRDVMVFTKVLSSGLDKKGVRKGAEGSLKRLGREVIDLYQVHWPSDEVPLDETWEAMRSLVDDGLVRYIGLSNFDRKRIEQCEKIRHVDSLQPHFSMLNRRGRDDLYPFCEENGTGVIAYGPMAFGLLTGALSRDTEFSDDDWRSGGMGIGYYDNMFAPGIYEKNLDMVDRLRPVAERLGITLPQLALSWVWHQRGVTGAIAGSRSPEHVIENAAAGDVELSDKDLTEIDEILAS